MLVLVAAATLILSPGLSLQKPLTLDQSIPVRTVECGKEWRCPWSSLWFTFYGDPAAYLRASRINFLHLVRLEKKRGWTF
jgi:hypothetical protein